MAVLSDQFAAVCLYVISNTKYFHIVDVISAIDFEDSGDHLAVADQGGRLIIFEKTPGKDVRITI